MCVCKNPETMIYNSQTLNCEPCPSGQHPNVAGTACEACPTGQERKNGECKPLPVKCSDGSEKPAE
jgi:hypothetical protein